MDFFEYVIKKHEKEELKKKRWNKLLDCSGIFSKPLSAIKSKIEEKKQSDNFQKACQDEFNSYLNQMDDELNLMDTLELDFSRKQFSQPHTTIVHTPYGLIKKVEHTPDRKHIKSMYTIEGFTEMTDVRSTPLYSKITKTERYVKLGEPFIVEEYKGFVELPDGKFAAIDKNTLDYAIEAYNNLSNDLEMSVLEANKVKEQ